MQQEQIQTHVQAWKQAKRSYPGYNTGDSTCERLLSEWFAVRWQIFRFGRMWTGDLYEVNHGCDVFFTMMISDPGHPHSFAYIEAPFEDFSPSEEL